MCGEGHKHTLSWGDTPVEILNYLIKLIHSLIKLKNIITLVSFIRLLTIQRGEGV